jgi:hypothetical protein
VACDGERYSDQLRVLLKESGPGKRRSEGRRATGDGWEELEEREGERDGMQGGVGE